MHALFAPLSETEEDYTKKHHDLGERIQYNVVKMSVWVCV